MDQKVIGIDPGFTGAVVHTNGEEFLQTWAMPIFGDGREKRIHFSKFTDIFDAHWQGEHVYLERPVSFGMSTNSAYSYGRGFEAIVITLELLEIPFTLIEPSKWTKEMHEGISADLKPKSKSLIAAQRLFPQLVKMLPTKPKGGIHDGYIDALLIAGYGLRRSKKDVSNDFY